MAIIEVINISEPDVCAQAGALVRRSFATEAAEFNLTRLRCPSHRAFETDEHLLQALYQPGGSCFGAYSQRNMIGFAAIVPWRRGDAELTRLCVAPEWRRREVGTFLVEYAMVYAKKQGARRMHIAIINENRRLKEWYRSFGFVALNTQRVQGLPFLVCEMVKTL
ncbi:MAG: GNAT family N-acetyltransferase [Oscillospiraceae bacterium]|jgi:ribosomal protein S18 acetylase RimI-like enzyme|nr:GNAT family N-acetyltransferase [Oscillospiraceae bacterium]